MLDPSCTGGDVAGLCFLKELYLPCTSYKGINNLSTLGDPLRPPPFPTVESAEATPQDSDSWYVVITSKILLILQNNLVNDTQCMKQSIETF
jgi:hypothetical protein